MTNRYNFLLPVVSLSLHNAGTERELCAVLGCSFVALHPDTKKIFKWWQKLELRWVWVCTAPHLSVTTVEKSMKTSMETDCLSPPRVGPLQAPGPLSPLGK